MGKMHRNKGRRGEAAAKLLLADRDWTVVDLSAGCNDADLLAIDPNGTTFLVEVKNQKLLKWSDWLKQAREQGNKRKLPWMLMVKIPDLGNSWITYQKGGMPTCWHGKEEMA